MEYIQHLSFMPKRMANLYLKDKFKYGFFVKDLPEIRKKYDLIYINGERKSWNNVARIVARKYGFKYSPIDDMTCILWIGETNE